MFSIENGKREGPTSLFDSTGKYIDDIYYEEGILVVDKIVLDSGPKIEEKKLRKLLYSNLRQLRKSKIRIIMILYRQRLKKKKIMRMTPCFIKWLK